MGGVEKVKQLTEAHWKAINLLVVGTMKKGDIAKECGVTAQSLSYWQKEEVFRKALRKAFNEAKEEAHMERVRLARSIAISGLEELEKRFKKSSVLEEKTKDIIDVISKVINIESEIEKLIPVAKTGDGQEGQGEAVVGGEQLNDDEFRINLRNLLKGETKTPVSRVGIKKSIKKSKR